MFDSNATYDCGAECSSPAMSVAVINLRERRDRFIKTRKEILRVFPRARITRINAIKSKKNPRLGCALSHKKALKYFRTNRTKNMFVAEDDVMFRDKVFNIRYTTSSLVKFNYDIIALGSHYTRISKKYSCKMKKVVKINYLQGAHFIYYPKFSLNKLLFLRSILISYDERLAAALSRGSISGALAVPSLVIQRAGFSNIRNQHYDPSHDDAEIVKDQSVQQFIYRLISFGRFSCAKKALDLIKNERMRHEVRKLINITKDDINA